jgi:hypothetical protein
MSSYKKTRKSKIKNVMLPNTGNRYVSRSNRWQYGDRKLIRDSGPCLAAFASLLKDCGTHGGKNGFMVK